MARQGIEPIEDSRKTIAAIVQDRIRQAILDGTLSGGSRLDQVQLAEDLNVSLVPIREALKKLEAEGFINIVPRRGAFVTQTSARDMEDVYAAREILEGQAASMAAEMLSDETLETLQMLVNDMKQALDNQRYEDFMVANRRFHFTIYEATHNHYVLNMINMLWDLSERYRFRYLMLEDRASVIQQEHQNILTACQERDKDKVRAAIVEHMQHTLATLLRAATSSGIHSGA